MKLTGLHVWCFLAFFCSVIPSASGHPLPTSSPEQIVAVAGKDVILPCNVSKPVADLCTVTVEWLWTDGSSNLPVCVLNRCKDYDKEQAEKYRGRTDIMRNCSLKLLGVQVQDSGTYRCVIVRGPSDKQEVSVSLIVVEVFEVNLSVQRTSANHLIIRCNSSSWSPKLVVSLLDSERNKVTDQTESTVQRPDGLYSVWTFVNLTAAAATITKNGTLICRVEIPGMDLWNETKIFLTDEFNSSSVSEATRSHYMLVVVLAFGVGVVVGVFLRWKRRSLHVFVRDQSSEQSLVSSSETFTEYGDINKVEVGAQFRGQNPDQPLLSDSERSSDQSLDQPPPSDSERSSEYGDINKVEVGAQFRASKDLAATDMKEMSKYKEIIISVGKKLKVHPALIAAIIYRQSKAGKNLRDSGYGVFDSNCFGLMQINKNYHAVKGNPYSEEHVDQGVTFLIQLILTMRRTKKDWSNEQQLKGALACYFAGEDKVIPLTYEEIDSMGKGGDFANDVIARAQWFAQNGY